MTELFLCRNYIINIRLHIRLCDSFILLMTFPQIQQQPERHEPYFFLRQTQMRETVIKQPGEKLLIAYPAVMFFTVSSLSIFRFVPRRSASVIADLYSARSPGEVSSSTVSSVSSSFGCALSRRL